MSMGRGRQAILPAWMKNPEMAAQAPPALQSLDVSKTSYNAPPSAPASRDTTLDAFSKRQVSTTQPSRRPSPPRGGGYVEPGRKWSPPRNGGRRSRSRSRSAKKRWSSQESDRKVSKKGRSRSRSKSRDRKKKGKKDRRWSSSRSRSRSDSRDRKHKKKYSRSRTPPKKRSLSPRDKKKRSPTPQKKRSPTPPRKIDEPKSVEQEKRTETQGGGEGKFEVANGVTFSCVQMVDRLNELRNVPFSKRLEKSPLVKELLDRRCLVIDTKGDDVVQKDYLKKHYEDGADRVEVKKRVFIEWGSETKSMCVDFERQIFNTKKGEDVDLRVLLYICEENKLTHIFIMRDDDKVTEQKDASKSDVCTSSTYKKLIELAQREAKLPPKGEVSAHYNDYNKIETIG